MRKTDFNRQKLIKKRLELNFTKIKVAEKIGMSDVGYGLLERKSTVPSAEKLAKLSKLFKVDMEYFFGIYR